MECYPSDDVGILWFQKLRLFFDKKNGFKVLKLHIRKASIDVEQLKLIQSRPYELEHVELQIETIKELSVYVDVFAYEKLLQQEDQGQTNIIFVLSSKPNGKKHFKDLNSLLAALPRVRLQTITFLKEEGTLRRIMTVKAMQGLHDALTKGIHK
ncbi:hypothetical protein Tco_0760214 [Tanacetum coccineum]